MSRHHLEIDKFPEGFRIRDLDSGNGTILNGRRIKVGQLRNGDIIEIGGVRFRFEQTGGDPEELWKGEPKVELHPNQRGIKSTYKPKDNAGPAESPSSSGSAPAVSSGQPQMNTMLERQGGGIAATPWQPTMTNPYMMASYGQIRNVNTPPLWANLTLVALIVLCLGSIIWYAMVTISTQKAEDAVREQKNEVEKIMHEVTNGVVAYSEQRFSDAQANFNTALEHDKSGTIIRDKSLFEFYRKLIAQEEDISKEIKRIRDKTYGNTNGIPLEEYEEGLDYLQGVPETSVNKMWAKTIEPKVIDAYSSKLRSEIRTKIQKDKFDDARKLLLKLQTLPETAVDVKALNKTISDKEAAANK